MLTGASEKDKKLKIFIQKNNFQQYSDTSLRKLRILNSLKKLSLYTFMISSSYLENNHQYFALKNKPLVFEKQLFEYNFY